MPFEIIGLSGFKRHFKRLGSVEQKIAGLIIEALLAYFEAGVMASDRPFVIYLKGRAYRLTFKKLRGPIWEAYVESHLRILTRLEGNIHNLVFVGNHDQVRQFLKEN